jgi:hypothetical protein
MAEDALVRRPRLPAVVRAEQDARRAAEPEPSVLAVAARADVPELLELEARILG